MYFLTNENPHGRSLSLRRHTFMVGINSFYAEFFAHVQDQ